MSFTIDVKMLKSITEEKMIEMKFWELPEADFRKLNAALERKNELKNFMKDVDEWDDITTIIDPETVEEYGIDRSSKVKKYYTLNNGDGETEELYFIADEDLDGLIIIRKNGEISRISLKPEHWMPDYYSIIRGTDQSLSTYYSDILDSVRYGVSPYAYRLLIEFSREFKEAMDRITPEKKSKLIKNIRRLNLYDVYTFLGSVSKEFKNRCEIVGLFPLIYIIMNYESPA